MESFFNSAIEPEIIDLEVQGGSTGARGLARIVNLSIEHLPDVRLDGDTPPGR